MNYYSPLIQLDGGIQQRAPSEEEWVNVGLASGAVIKLSKSLAEGYMYKWVRNSAPVVCRSKLITWRAINLQVHLCRFSICRTEIKSISNVEYVLDRRRAASAACGSPWWSPGWWWLRIDSVIANSVFLSCSQSVRGGYSRSTGLEYAGIEWWAVKSF